ncbi:uncharacterized protein HMPREF1541_03245 [Cyphellophora europaea CBS 101466]|uniref:Aldose 1-epimerase n=1 Tax=Cyphellophora europaea (strain CBS 101466) TaxID=1220924 RepID=W2RYA0_CYPE1|nr:uncharacterized protein HMPREF1541_03245 [Cyphellophora europaea CBS 101466]ETN41310.1 hypothetical protein HMPREF1541_03245 [Cyphellophora europaea CBS 101466]
MAPESAFTFLPTGALIQEFKVGGQNIVLGFPNPEPYKDAPFFGETIGRVANRIKNGVISDLNGTSYQLFQNNGQHSLHGGKQGWGRKVFKGPVPTQRHGTESVQFTYVSPDGDEGYPGTVELRVWYTAFEEKEDGVDKTVLITEYEVELIGDEVEETAVNITNHSYFNVSGAESIAGTEATLSTSKYQVVDDAAIPTGAIDDFPGVEANKTFTLGPQEPSIDHCFVLNPSNLKIPLDTRESPLNNLVRLYHPATKIHLDIFSTEPAFQFYTGAFIDVAATEHTPKRGPRAGLCVEPSRYINAINVPEWRNQMLLKKGQKWGSKTVYRAWQD